MRLADLAAAGIHIIPSVAHSSSNGYQVNRRQGWVINMNGRWCCGLARHLRDAKAASDATYLSLTRSKRVLSC